MDVRSAAASASGGPLSLASYAASLGHGSVCFCCGGEMRSPRTTVAAVRNLGVVVVAVCAECGSEIAIAGEDAETVTSACGACSRLVAAA
jgi:hypothetical protein